MKLYVDFDDALIEKYVRRGSNPLFTIYWKQGGEAYPEEQWQDFGSVIIGWWLVAAKSLLGGSREADLPFMDGPYRLHARLIGNMVSLTTDDQSWKGQISTEVFVAEILGAARKVQQKLEPLGISDSEDLQIGIRQLQTAASGAITSRKTRGSVIQYS